jgi:hypothetical protein
MLERIVRNKLIEYTIATNLINKTQHGFQNGKSTDTILLKFYDYVSQEVDDNKIVDVVYFDFSKAFDVVPHKKLIRRLNEGGISGKVLMWISNFLSDRRQKVRIGNAFSDPLPVTSGVIQGSVMGPFLFNIFINNVDSSLKYCHILKYADDIRIFISSHKNENDINDMHLKLQYDINKIVEWTAISDMSLNTDKCFHAAFGKSSNTRNYYINDCAIPTKSVFKDLGVTATTPLSFNKHVDVIVSKAYTRLGLIYKLFETKSPRSISRLYKAFVRPILEFSSIIWNPYTQYRIMKIERIQKRMCNMIPAIRGKPYQEQLKLLGLFTLQSRRTRYQLISVFKLRRQITKISFKDLFTTVVNKRTRGHNCTIAPRFARNNYRLNFFTVAVIELWNKLSQEDIDSPSLIEFKNKVQIYLSSHNIW